MVLRLPSLVSLRALEAAARLRSFKKAAEELAVTATAISHRIRDLEQHLGRPLFLRRARAVELTPDGQALFVAVSAGFQGVAEAIDHIRRPRRASVTVSATPAFAYKWLVPKLAGFQAAHPDIDLFVHASNAPADLNAGVADLAIRYGPGEGPGVAATVLTQDVFAPVASPALLRTLAADASLWPLIRFDWHRPLPVDLTWDAWARAAGLAPASLAAGVRYSEESHAIQAAVSGQGVGLLSLALVQEELRLGWLAPAPGPRLKGMAYHLLRPSRRPLTEAAVTVEAWLAGFSRPDPGLSPPA